MSEEPPPRFKPRGRGKTPLLSPGEMKEWYEAGATLLDIAFHAATSPTTVARTLKANGVAIRRRGTPAGVPTPVYYRRQKPPD